MSAGLAYTWRDEPTDFALQLGAGLTMFTQLQPDIYVQLPRRTLLGLDGGVGLVALLPSETWPMPYFQLGKLSSGSGPFITVGYLRQMVDTTKVEDPVVAHADGWSTTLAVQFRTGFATWRPFVTGVFGGHLAPGCAGRGFDCSTLPPPRSFSAGLTLELHRSR